MSAETNKVLVRRFYDQVLNGRRVQAIDELAVAGYDEHDPLPGQREGRDGLKDRVSMLVEGLAPTFTVEDVVAEGDRVVVRWTNSARHVLCLIIWRWLRPRHLSVACNFERTVP